MRLVRRASKGAKRKHNPLFGFLINVGRKIHEGFHKIKEGFIHAGKKINEGFIHAGKKMKEGFIKAGHWIKETGAKMAKFALKVVSTAASVAGRVMSFIPGVGKAVGKAFHGISKGWTLPPMQSLQSWIPNWKKAWPSCTRFNTQLVSSGAAGAALGAILKRDLDEPLSTRVTYSAPILLPRDISSKYSATPAALQVGQCTTLVCTAKTPGVATSAKTRTRFSRDDTTGALNSFGDAIRKPVDDKPTTSHRSADKQVLQRRGVFDKIGNAFKGAFNKVKNVAQKAVNGVKNVAQKAVNGVKKVANKAVNGVKNTVKKAVNGVKNVTNKATNGVKNAVKKAVNGVRNATNKAVNGVKKVVNKAVNGVKKVVNTVKKGVKNVVNKVKQGVKTAIQTTKQGLVKAGGWIKKNGAQIA
ncbi:hypothetical protein M408DRAFT_27092, partial [Serendipita vermifera MAFF 305830]